MSKPSARAEWLAFSLRYKVEVARRVARRRRAGVGADAPPRIAVAYACDTDFARRQAHSLAFVSAYKAFPPTAEHTLHVMIPGAEHPDDTLAFNDLEHSTHHCPRAESDVGLFHRAAGDIDCDLLVCLGSRTAFRRPGWLREMASAFAGHGDGLYGAHPLDATEPFLAVSALWCAPMLLRAYPSRADTPSARARFEAGDVSLSAFAARRGLGPWLVTWDGVFPVGRWEEPPAIMLSGEKDRYLTYERD